MAKTVIFKCATEGCANFGIEGSLEVEDDFSSDVWCVCNVNIGKAK